MNRSTPEKIVLAREILKKILRLPEDVAKGYIEYHLYGLSLRNLAARHPRFSIRTWKSILKRLDKQLREKLKELDETGG